MREKRNAAAAGGRRNAGLRPAVSAASRRRGPGREAASTEVHVELLVGRQVVDVNGEEIGHIEEIIAENIDGEMVAIEFHVGRFALAERFSIFHFGSWLVRRLGAHGASAEGQKIPWQKLDLSDPAHPRTTCAKDELQRVDAKQ
jgi:sporulation protein YlmC with PRC-barrel domain